MSQLKVSLEHDEKKVKRRTFCELLFSYKYRLLFPTFLLVITILAAVVVDTVFRNNARSKAINEFDAITEQALKSARAITKRKFGGAKVLASTFQSAHPDASSWPFVALTDYESLSSEIKDVSNGRNLGFAPIVLPSQLQQFEEFAFDLFDSRSFPPSTAVHSFGRGVHGVNPALNTSDNKYHETDGNTTYNSPNYIFTPITQHSVGPCGCLLVNMHYEETRGRAMDNIIECSAARAESNNISAQCGLITDIFFHIRSPAGMIYQPIYPSNNKTKVGDTVRRTTDILISTFPCSIHCPICNVHYLSRSLLAYLLAP